MKRNEEIEKAAQKCEWISKSLNLQSAFIEGAKWADKTMLDRACEWLRFRVSVDVPIETNENGEPLADSWIKAQLERMIAADEFVAAFRQVMEGGAE